MSHSLICRQLTLALVASAIAGTASAFTTSQGQTWDTEPDAWARGNTADSSWFGWDRFDVTGPPNGPFGSTVLNDASPEIGGATTATSTLITQSVASAAIYGHQSGSQNYYSGFLPNAFADDTISGVAPASGAGGATTIVLQVIGQPTSGIAGLDFLADAAWTKTSDLYGQGADGTGLYWQEWTAPGANVPFSIDMTSFVSSVAIDAFQVDTYWAPSPEAVTNARGSIGVPEPATALLMTIALAGLSAGRRV